jgi:uncharacterized protein
MVTSRNPNSSRPQQRPAAAPSRPQRPAAAARPSGPPRAAAPVEIQPLTDQELSRLQALLDEVPAPLEPLDVTMVDGFLCGVLLQPQSIPAGDWLRHITDADGRALPRDFDARPIWTLVRRRHAELAAAIAEREWFDPWVFELSPEEGEFTAESHDPSEAVYPWVAGFATAQEFFPALMRFDESQLTEPLALLYRHLAADDLEDADALIEEIESLEPPADLSVAVEELVRATLLLADVSLPVDEKPARPPAAQPRRGAPPPRRR